MQASELIARLKRAIGPRLWLIGASALIASTALAAVTQQKITTAKYGSISCWIGDSADNTITDTNLNCIQGRGGKDTMKGGGGNDRLDAEFKDNSRDDMYGGSGTDTFYVGTGYAAGDSRIDRIQDMTSGETICSRAAFTKWYRTVKGTSGNHRFIVVNDLIGGTVVIAWVRDLGSKSITVRSACYLMNQ